METQKTIADWADDTFGPALDPGDLVTRAADELEELLEAVQKADKQEIGKEAADVVILLMRVMELNGLNLHDEVDKKMQINRSRTWVSKGDGTGSHIKG